MTGTAFLLSVEMSRRFACGSHPVVARSARPKDLVVIDPYNRRPGHRAVAILADIRRLGMVWRFAGSIGTVVATNTVTRNVHMIEVGWNPADSRVAVVAVVAAGYVRRVLAGSDCAVVTG